MVPPTYGCYEDWDEEYQLYCRAVEEECHVETWRQDLVRLRFQRVYFVSRSKGRGRLRKHWEEVVLICDKLGWPGGRWYSEKTFPWDIKANGEVLPEIASELREKELVRRIGEL